MHGRWQLGWIHTRHTHKLAHNLLMTHSCDDFRLAAWEKDMHLLLDRGWMISMMEAHHR